MIYDQYWNPITWGEFAMQFAKEFKGPDPRPEKGKKKPKRPAPKPKK